MENMKFNICIISNSRMLLIYLLINLKYLDKTLFIIDESVSFNSEII